MDAPGPGIPGIPAAFLARMEGLLGSEYLAFAASFDEPPVTGLRVNTLKVTAERLAQMAPFPLEPLPWPPGAFIVPAGGGDPAGQPGKHPFHAAGLYYLQDPSAMAAAALLAPQPGERVLDLAAAPGGKATHLAALLQGQGLLVANEIHPKRVWDLAENLERWGATNVVVANETPERLVSAFAGYFDRVLVDAPCSGEGMLRRGPAARLEWAPSLIEGCALRQAGILDQASQAVRPGGTLAYVTCTFAPEEDEGTVAGFLERHPDFELCRPDAQPGFAAGRPDWLPASDSRPDLARAVRLWPHLYPGEGHFIALLRRTGEAPGADGRGAPDMAIEGRGQRERSGRRRKGGGRAASGEGELPRGLEKLYREFCAAHLTLTPGEGQLSLAGTYLYSAPEGLPDLAGLRIVHPGWWLGVFKKERFEPSHALALALPPAGARLTVDFARDDPRLLAYLRGETFPAGGPDGWVLVTVAGFSLGWARRSGDRLKSHYPRGLRRL